MRRSATDFRVRRAEPDDHPALVDVWLRSVRATHTFLTNDDIESLLPIVRDSALDALELWVLCTSDPGPVGFVGLSGASVEALFIAPRGCASAAGGCLSSTHGD